MTDKFKLMAIFAHPDDEAFGTGGTLTKYVHQGVDVHLVMATRGEAGRVANPAVTTTLPMSLLREQELRCACSRYGIEHLHFLGYIDGQTTIVPPSEPVFKLVKLLREVKPQVVLSFGLDGIYGHFDHLAVHRWATAAVTLAAAPEQWPELGPLHQVAKFYHRAMPQTQVEHMKEIGGRAAVDMSGVPFPFVGYPHDQITTVIDVREHAETKLAAILCHKSQLAPDALLLQEEFDPLANDWFWQETFILAQTNRVELKSDKEDDLFAGVRRAS